MLRIRLRRVGGKKQPSYRIVVAESSSPRDGRFVEVIGFYNPRTEPQTVRIKEARALHWLSVGAQPSDAVNRLLKNFGTLARFERLKAGETIEALVVEAEAGAESVSPSTKPAVAEEPEVEAGSDEEAAATEDEAQETEEPEAEVEEPEAEVEEPEEEEEREPEEEVASEDNAEAGGEPEPPSSEDASEAEPEPETES